VAKAAVGLWLLNETAQKREHQARITGVAGCQSASSTNCVPFACRCFFINKGKKKGKKKNALERQETF